MIVCPGCAAGADSELTVQESVTEWACPSCKRRYEVRIVFFERAEPVDAAGFRDEVQRLLAEQGLTKTELAKLVGVTPAYISTLLSGRRGVSAERANMILHVLDNPPTTSFPHGEP